MPKILFAPIGQKGQVRGRTGYQDRDFECRATVNGEKVRFQFMAPRKWGKYSLPYHALMAAVAYDLCPDLVLENIDEVWHLKYEYAAWERGDYLFPPRAVAKPRRTRGS